MLRLRWSLFFTGSLLIGVVCSQSTNRRLCNAQITCGDCILANPECIWCADTAFNGTRCYPRGDTTQEVCLLAMIQDPQGAVGNIQEVTLTGFNQVSPTRVEVRVRPGQSETFPLSVRPARNFPIDVYLLMDLSFSMRDDLASLRVLGSDLADNIVTLSNNFTIGFGSYVEKVAGPFVSLDERFQQDPCRNNAAFRPCVSTYSYRHTISLTSDADRFDQLVQQQRISGNQDSPEGGFDGFLQSLLCTELIGWRGLSRKLLLYITDAGFHLAGDGKLGGIILPHPNRCLITSPPLPTDEVEYEDSLTYDYPSVGQIAQALRTQDIIPIFAAVNSVRGLYDALAAELGEGAFVGTLASDSSNVVELVETLYNTISQRVIFDQEPIPGVSVVATPTSCPGGFIEDGICTGLEIEQTATYDISVSVSECTPELLNGQTTLDYRLVGFGTVRIDLTALCQCECENTTEANAAFCSNNGNLTCGLCICNSGFFGERCQCDSANQGNTIDCPTGDNNLQCSDRGTCQCGICNCPEGFFGLACECDESQCLNQDSGLLCSGRGTCGCDGNCTCTIEPVSQLPYFGGDVNTCECTPNTQNCRDPTNQTSICNGRGTCGCDGSCECEDPYFGQFCDLCSGSDVCLFLNCDSNQECSNCALDLIVTLTDNATEFFRTAEENALLPPGSTVSQNLDTIEVALPGDFCSSCDNGVVIISGADTAEYDIEGEPAVRCEVVRDGCVYRYFVAVDANTNNFTAVHVEYEGNCPTVVSNEARGGTPPWIIALSIIIPLLVAGLFLLALLKALLLLWDYIEVQKFDRDIKNTKYSKNENPLYRSAAKDYKNPIYGQ